jgi:multiple sugar transport system substrate-binding protein
MSNGRNLSRREMLRLAGLAGAAIAAGSLAACGATATPTTAPKPTVAPTKAPTAVPPAASTQKITLKATVRDYTLKIDSPWTTATKTLQKKYPGLDVQLEGMAYDDQRQKTLIAVAAGQGPDIVQLDCIWVGEFADGKTVIDLSPYYASWKGASDVPDNYLKAAQFNGKYYGVWLNSDVRFLTWEKSAVKDAGFDPLVAPKTWEELANNAVKAQKTPSLWGYGFPAFSTDHTADRFYPFLWQGGGEILTADYKKAAFNSDAGVAALQMMTDMMRKYKVSPVDLMTTGEGDVTKAVDEGKYAYGIRVGPGVGADRFKGDATAFLAARGVAHLPLPPGGKQATGSGGWLLGITRDSKQADIAWEYITVVVDQTNAAPFWKYNTMVPVSKSAAANVKEYEAAFPYFNLVGEALTFTHFRPPIPAYTKLSVPLVTGIQKALAGQATPKAALDEAAVAVNAILAG